MNARLRLRFCLLMLCGLLATGPAVACPLSSAEVIRADSFESCARELSSFQKLGDDLTINGTAAQVVLGRNFTLPAAAQVLVVADGRYYPIDAPAGSVRIRIDGDEAQSSVAITDWGSSALPVMHGFNVLADARLEAGSHTIELVASAHPSRPGRFSVGSASGLSILLQPLSRIDHAALPGQSAQIDLTTYAPAQGIDVREGDLDRPVIPLLGYAVRNLSGRSVDAITLASGRGYYACNNGIDNGFGDALLGLFADGVCQSTHSASWSVNDLHPDAELQAGMMLHGVHRLGIGQQRSLSLVGSELAFGSDQAGSPSGAHENGVCWGLGSARMLTASAGAVTGAAVSGPETACATYTWRCVATTLGQSGCPQAGTDVVISTAQVQIPVGHDGIVLFNARTRIQAGNDDGFATVILGIKIDGQPVSALGLQQLAVGAGQASRTLSASYLSAPGTPTGPLSVGTHTVEAYINVSGNPLRYPSVPSDVSLTWFD
jgi:hypothetical protein